MADPLSAAARPDPLSDAELVERVERGDRTAFDELVERYYEVVIAAAYAVVLDVDAAKDCAQEAFVEAVENLSDLRDKTKVGQWLRGIAHRKAIYILRRRHGYTEALKAKTDQYRAKETPDAPPEQMHKAEKLESIRRAMTEIPPIYREVLVMKYLDGRSHADISRVLNLSVAAVDKRLMRGKQMLHESLKRWQGDE